MTIITKPLAPKPQDKLPLVNENSNSDQNEANLDVESGGGNADIVLLKKETTSSLAGLYCGCLFVIAILTFIGFCIFSMYKHYEDRRYNHYKGWCTLPIDETTADAQFHVMPIMSTTFPFNDPDVEVIPDVQEKDLEDFGNYLRETFEILNNVEKFEVTNLKDRKTTDKIIHDFSTNKSGIVDSSRCYVMELDPELVMPPEVFIDNIQTAHKNFDLSPIKNIMRAILPPLIDFNGMGEMIEKECSELPTYLLRKHQGIIRKRSIDLTPAAKFKQFSGKHVQEINIDNLDELLAYEEGNSQISV